MCIRISFTKIWIESYNAVTPPYFSVSVCVRLHAASQPTLLCRLCNRKLFILDPPFFNVASPPLVNRSTASFHSHQIISFSNQNWFGWCRRGWNRIGRWWFPFACIPQSFDWYDVPFEYNSTYIGWYNVQCQQHTNSYCRVLPLFVSFPPSTAHFLVTFLSYILWLKH